MPERVLDVDHIVKKYNDKKAVLADVTFSVREKEFVTIFGKSGCGKTTLLNILGGLDRPTSGSLFIDGDNIVGLSEDRLATIRLAKIGFVFQDYNLLMDMTVRENVALPLRFSARKDDGFVDELLEKFNIKHLAREDARKISGGEAQRTAIARALINKPRIILADEPTGNLDLESTETVLQTFRLAMKDLGTTVVLATHDREIARYATSKIYLDKGRAVFENGDVP